MTPDEKKSRAQLLAELVELRRRVDALTEQKAEANRAGADAQDESDLVREYLDCAPAIIFVLNPDGTIRLVNRKGCEVLGYAKKEILGESFSEAILSKKSRGECTDLFEQILAGKAAALECHENVVVTKGGEEKIVSWQCALVMGEGGTVEAIISAGQDITRRKYADEALMESRRLLRQVIDLVPHHIHAMDANGRFIVASRAVAESYGLKPEELVGKLQLDLAENPEEAKRSLRDDREVIETGKPKFISEEVYTDRNHKKHWLQTTKVPFDYHGERAVLINAVDITERKRAEEELSSERNLLETLMFTSPDSVYFKDIDSRFTRASKALTDRFGLSHPSQAIGKTDFDFYGEEHARQAYEDEQEIMRSGKPLVGFVERETWPDGHETWVSTTKVPLHNDKGEIVGIYGMSRDITERKYAEERLRAYAAKLDKANEEIKRFTYIVSHDLRAPLVNLKGFANELTTSVRQIALIINKVLSQLKDEEKDLVSTALEEDIPEALEFINSSVTRMDAFINALLSLSRLGYRKLAFEPVNLNQVVEATLKTLAHQIEERNAVITVGKLPVVVADKVAMEQVMANVLNNAVVYLEPDRPGKIEVDGEELDGGAIIRIKDNGRGIAEKDMDKVFTPFRRAGKQNVKGEGMGLSYVQALIRRHNGSIQCESQLGVGTTFTLTIPKSPRKEPSNV